jgi:hypothetical protein
LRLFVLFGGVVGKLSVVRKEIFCVADDEIRLYEGSNKPWVLLGVCKEGREIYRALARS